MNMNSFRDRETLLVILGIVLVSASPVGILIGGTPVRYAILSMGFGLLLWVSLSRLILDHADVKSLTVFLGIILAIETLNVVNLAEPMNAKFAAYRWICYGMAQIGMSLGKARTFHLPQSSSTYYLLIPLIISAASLVWISGAVALAGPERFRGESEELSPVGVGYSFGLLAIVSVAFLLTETRPLSVLLHLTAMILAISAALTTGSRGPFLAFVIISAFGSTLKIKSPATMMRYGGAFLLVICVFAVALQWVPYLREQSDYIISRFDSLMSDQRDESMSVRDELRNYYYDSVDTWITLGFHGYRYEYPHNFFLEIAVRFGIFGILLCLAVLGVSVKAVVSARSIGDNIAGLIILMTGLFTLIVAQFSLMLEFERCLWLFVGYCSVKEFSRSVHYVRA
jgi:hypothetical protein